jgi:outer membrane protein OmpA-like peptidoglycan-associated protein
MANIFITTRNLKQETRNFWFSLIVILSALFYSTGFYAQGNLPPGTYTSSNKKAIKYYEEGKKHYEVRSDKQAEELLKKAVKEDENFIEAHSALAYLLMEHGRADESIPHFEKAIAVNPKFFPQNYYYLANAYMMAGKYEDAVKSYDALSKFERVNPGMKEKAAKERKNAEFGAKAVKNPRQIKPINMGKGINTDFNEYFPSITADGKQFLFTREIKMSELDRQEDFYISKKDGIDWKDALPMFGVNTNGNEGAPSISADGNFMFFASCMEMDGNYGSMDRKGYGSCDIFYSEKRDGKWTKPVNVGPPINTANWETQPSFSSDGKTLYFVRGMVSRGDIKEQDIYMSVIGPGGKFGDPVKLSDMVNTPGQEESVFIHPDNQTLYFSSDGHPGLGGLDIYMSKRRADGTWGEAVNLGYPINSYADENSWLVDPSGKYAYFASTKEGGFGGLDIYYFELPEDIRPEKLTYVKGRTYDARTKEPVSAKFELIDMDTQQSVTESYSDKAGQFLVTLTGNKNYIVNVAKDGYLFYSDNFSLKGKETDFNKPFLLDIPLQPIDTGSTVELKNVFFDVDKWELKPESKAELDKLIFFLTKNPSVKIELGGHTDNSGKKEWNKTLSTNRAKAVYEYVIKNGKIDEDRLSYKGYADTKPKVPNDTPENKAKNRRTEFKVTGK